LCWRALRSVRACTCLHSQIRQNRCRPGRRGLSRLAASQTQQSRVPLPLHPSPLGRRVDDGRSGRATCAGFAVAVQTLVGLGTTAPGWGAGVEFWERGGGCCGWSVGGGHGWRCGVEFWRLGLDRVVGGYWCGAFECLGEERRTLYWNAVLLGYKVCW
jgi:hypothetical protein